MLPCCRRSCLRSEVAVIRLAGAESGSHQPASSGKEGPGTQPLLKDFEVRAPVLKVACNGVTWTYQDSELVAHRRMYLGLKTQIEGDEGFYRRNCNSGFGPIHSIWILGPSGGGIYPKP